MGAQVLARLGEAPCVLVLDSAETPWWADTEGTEAAFATLAAVPGLVLVASLRGRQRPFGLAWCDSIDVPPLAMPEARMVFLAVSGQSYTNDPHLDLLVAAQDGLPLTIELLAYLAEGEPLIGHWHQWTERRVDMIRRNQDGPGLSMAVSFDLSINGPRTTDHARRLLSLLSVLPDGIAHEDLNTLLPGIGNQAAMTLRKVGLALDDQARLRVAQPIRDYVQVNHAPRPDDLARAVSHYSLLAEPQGWQVGRPGGVVAGNRLLRTRQP
jgi:hypothetical protein